MTRRSFTPQEVIPAPLAEALAALPYWFVIGGHAVRCLCPYRPSRDVDFGVPKKTDASELIEHLGKAGTVDILERSEGTTHLLFDDVNVSVFVLDALVPFTEGQRLTTEGILATKLKAILGRGLRRDFFDLYVTMQVERRSLADCLAAMRAVYGDAVDESLLLRALAYFEDAERQAPLPGESKGDWTTVKTFFMTSVGTLLTPPPTALSIQSSRVDVRDSVEL